MALIENVYLYETVPNDLSQNGDVLMDWVTEPEITRQINGEFSLFGTYSLEGQFAKDIKKGKFVKALWENDTWQYFEIKDYIKDLTTISINAFHIGYMANRNFIGKSFTQNGNGQAIMNDLKANQAFAQRFEFKSTVPTHHQFTAKQVNVIDAIIGSNNGQQNLVAVTGGELDMDNFTLNLKDKIGEDNGYRIDFGINLESIEENVNDMSVVNSLFLIGAVPEGTNYDAAQDPITFSFLEVSGVNDSNRKIAKRENADCKTIAELKAWGQSLFDKDRIHEPKATHEVNMVMLENTEEYKDLYDHISKLHFGDTAYCNLKEIDIEVVERMVQCTWYPRLKKYKDVVLGNELGTYTSSVNTAVQAVATKIEQKSEQLLGAVINATNWITGTTGGYVRFRPKNAPSEILIMDTDDVATAKKVWRWNLGGLGYSSTGVNGPFGLAMTQDGVIVADYIKSGIIQADVFQNSFNKAGDVLKLVDSTLQIWNDQIKIMELTKQGLEFWRNSTKIGQMGTYGTTFGWTSGGELFTDKSIFINLDEAGEAIQISPKKDFGIQLLKNGDVNSKGDWAHDGSFGVMGAFRLVGEMTTAGDWKHEGPVNITGGLTVDGVPVTGGSGGGTSPGTPPVLTTEQEKNAWQVWSFLKDKGYTEQAAAAILGNMQGESGIYPDKDEVGSGIGYGLVQWTASNGVTPGRTYIQQKLATAGITGDYRLIETQMKLLEWDMFNGQYIQTSGYPYSPSEFKKLTNIATATMAFERNFERPLNTHPERIEWANDWYTKLHGLVGGGRYVMPVPPGYRISSWFGDRDDPLDPGNTRTHLGMDFADAVGTPIFAAENGEVIASMGSAQSGGFGEYIVIKHPDGNYTGYAHLSERMKVQGANVSKGQQIGKMGSTGNSTGSHLHFSVGSALWGPYQDPAPYLGLTK